MKKIIFLATIISVICISASVLADESVFAPVDFNAPERSVREELIEEGITVDGVDVSGMKPAAAERAVYLKDTAALGSRLTVRLGEKEVSVNWRTFDVNFDRGTFFDEIGSYGKGSGILNKYKAVRDLDAMGREFRLPVSYDKTKVTEFVLTDLKALDCEPKDADITRESGQFVITPSEQGIVVDTDETTRLLMEVLDLGEIKDTSVEAKTVTAEPRITEEMLSEIKDVLGTCRTDVGGTDNRATNVKVGSANINGTILLPGESASVSKLLKPRTKENGYRLAPQYNNGRSQDVYGGGICQVSSTLYNALLGAEIQIDERHNHSMLITYLSASKDAAISEGFKDLKFTNNLDYPIYIEGASVDRVCTFTVYGKETRPANRKVIYKSVITYQHQPDDRIVYVADQPVGYIRYEGDARHQETKSYLKKIVTVDGQVVSEEVLHQDYYMGSAKTAYVGTLPVEQPQPEPQPQPQPQPQPES